MIDNQTTLVTALYDIGRGNWKHWARPFDDYISYFKNILSLQSNLVIFIDESHLDIITQLRKVVDPELSHTKIIVRHFNELECVNLFFTKTKNVMESDYFKSRLNDSTPESLYPEYNLINFNKISFLEEAINCNHFNSDYFMWIDAGFYHNKFPKQYLNIVYPNREKIKLLDDNKVHFLCICPISCICLESYFSARVSITGSMFAGKAEPLLKLKQEIFKTIEEFLNNCAINDDQTIYAYTYSKNKELFRLHVGDWFDNFKIYI